MKNMLYNAFYTKGRVEKIVNLIGYLSIYGILLVVVFEVVLNLSVRPMNVKSTKDWDPIYGFEESPFIYELFKKI